MEYHAVERGAVMQNTYLRKGNEIWIEAPGDGSKNRIKNDLVWDINKLLAIQFHLYRFFLCKKPPASALCIPVSGFPPKYIAFQPLDDMFLHPRVLQDDEMNRYREIMDPARKIKDDVFREMCCLENVDAEYVTAGSLDCLSNTEKTCKSMASFRRHILSYFPVYISLFGAKEMQIVVNQSGLLEPILGIVAKHCVEKA